MKVKAIITGSTGMVGEGVLHQCLLNENVEKVLVINRRPCGVKHEKLTEIIHNDFSVLTPIADKLSGFNACYFCAGVTSVGKKEKEYTQITYDLTLHMANILVDKNTDMTFCYISGVGTDSTEKGKTMWARVKGKTENDLTKLPFKAVYNFRPGYIQPIKGLKNTYTFYKIVYPFYPIIKTILPKYTNTLANIGNAMISVAANGYNKNILECRDIDIAANQL